MEIATLSPLASKGFHVWDAPTTGQLEIAAAQRQRASIAQKWWEDTSCMDHSRSKVSTDWDAAGCYASPFLSIKFTADRG